jgi:hypothetical protein
MLKNLALSKYLVVISDFAPIAHAPVARAVYFFKFVASVQFVDLYSFVDRQPEMNDCFGPEGCHAMKAGSQNFAAANVAAGSGARIESGYCCFD